MIYLCIIYHWYIEFLELQYVHQLREYWATLSDRHASAAMGGARSAETKLLGLDSTSVDAVENGDLMGFTSEKC